MVYILIGIVCGFVFGALLGSRIFNKKSVGSLVVDNSDPDGAFLFLEINDNINSVISKKEVTLTVKHKNYVSQK